VLVAAKTLALRRDVLYRILMFVNPAVGHSVERVHTLAALYDALQAQAAEAMLAIWQALPAAERTHFGHRPQSHDESRTRARAGATTQRNSAAPQANELRSVS
jgi:aromatic ring hydroxylase